MSASFFIRYRTPKVGFLVPEGDISALVDVAGLSSLLWGGIYNPIIVMDGNIEKVRYLIDKMPVDILCPIHPTSQMNELCKEFTFLQTSDAFAGHPLLVEDYPSKQHKTRLLSTKSLIEHYWNTKFKLQTSPGNSRQRIITWDQNDTLSNLFSIIFGYFDQKLNLSTDMAKLFQKGMRAETSPIDLGGDLDSEMSQFNPPLKTTGLHLNSNQGYWSYRGFYFGDPNSFRELVHYWNLRAAGHVLWFIPSGEEKRFMASSLRFIQELDALPDHDLSRARSIDIFTSKTTQEDIDKQLLSLPSQKSKTIHRIGAELEYPMLPEWYLQSTRAQSVVSTEYGRHVIHITLPKMDFVVSDDTKEAEREVLLVSVGAYAEFDYPGYTLRLPNIRSLNEFFAREVVINPYDLRVQEDGFGVVIKTDEINVSVRPVSNATLINQILQYCKIQSITSQPGLLAERIIEQLGSLDDARSFMIPSLRTLLKNMRYDDDLSKSTITKALWDEGRFARHNDLYIQRRTKPNLNPNDVLTFLLGKNIFRIGASFECDSCKLPNWLTLKEVDDSWTCQYCGHGNNTGLHLLRKADVWRYRKSGLFARDNNQEGAIPVILTLLMFRRTFHSDFIYSTALNVNANGKSFEIDFLVIKQGFMNGEIEIGVGEAKDSGGEIEQVDIDNLLNFVESVRSRGIKCYPIFAKTTDHFRPEELERFGKLSDEGIPFIAINNPQLDQYFPDWQTWVTDQRYRYAHSLEEMAHNSIYRYARLRWISRVVNVLNYSKVLGR